MRTILPLLSILCFMGPCSIANASTTQRAWERGEPRPEAVYRVTEVSRFQGTLSLDDGSKWTVSSSVSWFEYPFSGDRVTIRNLDRSHSMNFELVRLSDQRSLVCSPVEGPLLHGSRTLYIIDLNYETGRIELSDGSSWEVYENCSGWKLLWQWQPGDVIMPGSLRGQSGSSGQIFLFNCLRARWLAVDHI